MATSSTDDNRFTPYRGNCQISVTTLSQDVFVEALWVNLCLLRTAMTLIVFTALMRDSSKLIALSGGTTPFAKAQIHVYSPAAEGMLIFSVIIYWL